MVGPHHRMMPLRNDTTALTGLSQGEWHHQPHPPLLLSISSGSSLAASDHLEVTTGHSRPWVQWSTLAAAARPALACTITLQLSPGTDPSQGLHCSHNLASYIWKDMQACIQRREKKWYWWCSWDSHTHRLRWSKDFVKAVYFFPFCHIWQTFHSLNLLEKIVLKKFS